MKPPSRVLTTFAAGFLLLDALLLGYAGVVLRRAALEVAAAVCAGTAVLVWVAWRRYRRTVADLERARREMKQDVESIRDLLHSKHLQN